MSAPTFLDRILADAREDLQAARQRVPEGELERRIADASPVRGFRESLRRGGFCLIAEIKRRSPSIGDLRADNVREAPAAYEASRLVAAVSVLTNERYFSTGLEDLARIRGEIRKPVIRKDFIFEPYQVLEARAWGADAILLMANVVDSRAIVELSVIARELGMDVLVEVHTREEIDSLPAGVDLCGINSRKFRSTEGFVEGGASSSKDFSLEYSAFDLVGHLPADAIRVAESGIHAHNVAAVTRKFHAALVGTSLLRDPRGVPACLGEFETALKEGGQ